MYHLVYSNKYLYLFLQGHHGDDHDDHDYDRGYDHGGDDHGCGRVHEKSGRDDYGLHDLSALILALVLILAEILNHF